MARRKYSLSMVLGLALAVTASSTAYAQPGRGRTPKTWDQVVQSGVNYLKSSKAEDGTWSKEVHPGITGLTLAALFKTGKVTADDPAAAKGLEFIASLADKEEGHLAKLEEKGFQRNYITSVNLTALKLSGDPKYDSLIQGAVQFLKTSQIDEGEDKTAADPEYGGLGYQAGTRPDLSNTHFALDALMVAGVAPSDPVFSKALTFVSRAQNLASEHNTLPWANLINDGSFIYVITTRPDEAGKPVEPRPGYGSMTYAGIKCLEQCGVTAADPRHAKAREWLSKNYSVDSNMGREAGGGAQGYYYYLMTMAKSLSKQGVDEVVDASGKSHDWRKDITRALTIRQSADGSWGNEVGQWLENNRDLSTAYALMALSYAKPKL